MHVGALRNSLIERQPFPPRFPRASEPDAVACAAHAGPYETGNNGALVLTPQRTSASEREMGKRGFEQLHSRPHTELNCYSSGPPCIRAIYVYPYNARLRYGSYTVYAVRRKTQAVPRGAAQ